jgi:hypothetical protein
MLGLLKGHARRFFISLFPEEGPSICAHEGCTRKTVYNSVMCAKHHYEMIKKKPCPWDDEYFDLSDKERTFIEGKKLKLNTRQQRKKETKQRGKEIQTKCPKCTSSMRALNKINWLTLLAIIFFMPLGFILFIITGLIEKKARCNNCFYEETLHRVF